MLNINRLLRIKLLLTAAIIFTIITGYAQFGGGNGTEGDPYIIATAEHLDEIRNHDNRNRFYLQTADIDLGLAPWNEDRGWLPLPLGPHIHQFAGTYDGNGHKIMNMKINLPQTWASVGLFFSLEESAELRNINLHNVNIVGNNYVGGLAGSLAGDSRIVKCSVTGSIRGNSNVGGLVGKLSLTSSISDSYTIAHVHSRRGNVGGLVGEIWSDIEVVISNCYVAGPVTADPSASFIEVFIGSTNEWEIARVSNSYWNTESVGMANSTIGGEGLSMEEMKQSEAFTDWDFDELWAIDEGESYPHFRQQDPSQFHYPLLPPLDLYAFIAGDASVVINWSAPSIGEPDAYKIYRTDRFLQEVAADINEIIDNDVDNMTTYGYYVTALHEERESFPLNVFFITPVPGGFAGGRGTADDPYQVETTQHLEYIRHNSHVHFIQTADIDLSVVDNWQPISSFDDINRFTGSLNGNGFTVRNLTIDHPDDEYVGFFGYLGHNTKTIVLRNIVLENVNVSGRNYVGGLVGEVFGNTVIENCSVSGVVEALGQRAVAGGMVGKIYGSEILGSFSSATVTNLIGWNSGGLAGLSEKSRIVNSGSSSEIQGSFNVGGLIGAAKVSPLEVDFVLISDSYALGNVSGETNVGGLVGTLEAGAVVNSYAKGNVEGESVVGGFAGLNQSSGLITKSYATGNVSGRLAEIGGFTGRNSFFSSISNCYARGHVNGGRLSIGGFIGSNLFGNIQNCFSAGEVNPGTDAVGVGGFVGSHAGQDAVNSYWNIDSSGRNESALGIGRNTEEMKYPYDLDTYVGWDFEEIWQQDENRQGNDGYPFLVIQGEPPEPLEAPQIALEIVNIAGVDNLLITWESIEGANSYRIYASDNHLKVYWGDPVAIVRENRFSRPVNNRYRYYYVTSSIAEIPLD